MKHSCTKTINKFPTDSSNTHLFLLYSACNNNKKRGKARISGEKCWQAHYQYVAAWLRGGGWYVVHQDLLVHHWL